jgi:hypothetical protein
MKMKKQIVIFLFFLITLNIWSIDLAKLLYTRNFRYGFHAYNGALYQPYLLNDKEFQYQEKLIFDFGLKFQIYENSFFWIDLSYKDELLNKKIILEDTGFSYYVADWEFRYLYSKIQYSNRSRILNFNVRNNYYNDPVFIDHRFQGLQVAKKNSNLKITFSGGGNIYNTALIHNSWQFSSADIELELFGIYTGRSDFLNEKTYTGGLEFIKSNEDLFLYSTNIYHRLSASDTDKYETLNEFIIYPNSTIFFGANLIYSITDWKEKRDWQTRSIIGSKVYKFSTVISYEYQNSEINLINRGNRKYGLLLNYELFTSATIGLDLSCFDPTYADRYYQFGIQARLNYETD